MYTHYFFQLLGWLNKIPNYKTCLAYTLKNQSGTVTPSLLKVLLLICIIWCQPALKDLFPHDLINMLILGWHKEKLSLSLANIIFSRAVEMLGGSCLALVSWFGWKKRALGRCFLSKDSPTSPDFSSPNVLFCLSGTAHTNSVTWPWLQACIQRYFPLSGSKSTPQLSLNYKVGQDPGVSISFSFLLLPEFHAKYSNTLHRGASCDDQGTKFCEKNNIINHSFAGMHSTSPCTTGSRGASWSRQKMVCGLPQHCGWPAGTGNKIQNLEKTWLMRRCQAPIRTLTSCWSVFRPHPCIQWTELKGQERWKLARVTKRGSCHLEPLPIIGSALLDKTM